MTTKRNDRKAPKYVLRDLVLANGGIMVITPDIRRSRSFKGWEANEIRSLVYQIRKEFTVDNEVWAIHRGTIYAKEGNMPPEIWGFICRRRGKKISGVADQNRIYEEKYKRVRQEEEAQTVLNENIDVLAETMESSMKVVRVIKEIDSQQPELI